MPLILCCPKNFISTYARKFFIGICSLMVMFLCDCSLLNTPAWSDTFVYRDLGTGIYSNMVDVISHRYMRHIWITSDGVMAAVVQKGGYDSNGLVLYKTLDDGLQWTFETQISSNNYIVSDGIMDSDNTILLVTSCLGEDKFVNVEFIRLIYNPLSRSWSIDSLTPATVFASGKKYKASRATIAVDSNGVIWCAFRFQSSDTNIFYIRVKYSVDGGLTWIDSGNGFGTKNSWAEKSSKVISVGSRIALIYQDISDDASEFKMWAYREDSQALQDKWTSGSIAKMVSTIGDPYSSHWSVASDNFGNLHLSYEDNMKIKYTKYDAAGNTWALPLIAASFNGGYSNISAGANGDLYLFTRDSLGKKIIAKKYLSALKIWTQWVPISSVNYNGFLRMSSPERYNDLLPLVHDSNLISPYQLIYDLIDTLP